MSFTDDQKQIAFMAHIPQSSWKDVVEHFRKRYKDRQYLIVGEKTPYEHIHYLTTMSAKEYRNYANVVFRQKYQLKGRATKDNARQYGKVKEIRDLERLKAYMLKDGIEYNVNVFTNMKKKDLESVYSRLSFKKNFKYPYQVFIDHIKGGTLGHLQTFGQLQKKVITIKELALEWCKVNETRLPRKETLIFYAYKAGIISPETYIYAIYGNHHDDYLDYETPL